MRGRVGRFDFRKPPEPDSARSLCNTSPTGEPDTDKTELGRAGELALALYSIVSSDGEVQLFTPVADDDHVDATAGRRGGVPAIAKIRGLGGQCNPGPSPRCLGLAS